MMLKNISRKIFNSLGFEVRKLEAFGGKRMPVELTKQESEIVEYVMSNKLTMVSYERLWATIMACKYVVEQNIDGDFVECGVWRGGNAIAAAEIFKLYNFPRKVWLFDTFKGMTAPADNDLRAFDGESAENKYRISQKGEHNEWCYASLNDVRNNFAKRKLCSDNLIFVEGDVCETLNHAPPGVPSNISILRLDTDWYESTKKELEVLYPKLSVGGILIIDDYGHWSGSKKATDEYFEKIKKRPFLQYTDYSGRLAVKVD
jgi:O-methyltransferase